MAESPIVRGLRNRLEADTLNPEDKKKMALAKELRTLRKQGLTLAQCSAKLGINEHQAEQFARRGVYKLFCQYFEELERTTDEEKACEIARETKRQFVAFGPDALAYYRTCFLRNPPDEQEEKGEFKDDAKAMWATERVSKGLGLTEPEQTGRPVININIAHIRAEQEMVNADDAEAAAAAKAIDVTPTQS